MPERKNVDYYRERAETARQMADAAQNPSIARIHREMAEHYDRLAVQPSLDAPRRASFW